LLEQLGLQKRAGVRELEFMKVGPIKRGA